MVKKFIKYVPLLIAVIVFSSISYFRVFEHYELATLDLRYKFRPAQPVNPDIVIIEIGDDSIEKIGRWPFDRNWHATLLNILAHYGVKSVFFDVIFSEEGKGDNELIEASRKVDVYYPSVFELTEKKRGIRVASRYATPLLDLYAKVAKGTGHINTPPDIDGKIRRIPFFIKYQDNLYPALPLVLACDYLGIPKEEFKVPLDDKSSMIINYPAKWKDSFKHISYIDVIVSHYLESQGEEAILDLYNLKDKICFVGLTATGTHDINPVPLETLYPAVGTDASAFNALVTKNFIVRIHRIINLFIAFILAFIIVVVSSKFRPIISLGLACGVVALFLIIAFCLFAFFGVWINVFFPIVFIISVYLYSTLHRYNVERRQRELIEKELTIAKSIQQGFLPEVVPEIKGLDIAANMLTARHVGGDLYDFVDYGDGTLGVMIGDVSGKGFPAALFMAKVASEFRIFSKDKKETSNILKELNEQILKTSKTNLFVTMSYVFIDPLNKKLMFSSGGHLPIILAKEEGVKTLSAKDGMALGLFESDFSDEDIDISKGNVLVLYTDGVTEAINAKGEEFGMERLSNAIMKYKDLSCKEIIDMVYKDIKIFSGKTPQHDDITVIAIRIL